MTKDDQEFKKGDDVTWKSHGQTVHGTVEGKITEKTEAAGRTVDGAPARRTTTDETY